MRHFVDVGLGREAGNQHIAYKVAVVLSDRERVMIKVTLNPWR